MAQNTKPSRLLNLKKSSKTNKTISTHNATNSPFLRLPTELRHRIYEYALGGQAIHIKFPQQHKFKLTACVYSPTDYDPQSQQNVHDTGLHPALDLKADRLYPTLQHDDTHDGCHASHLRSRLALHLLQVCRQIHGEASLVPFSKNLFVTSGVYTKPPLRAFLATLVAAQVRAIAQLVVSIDHSWWHWSPRDFGMLELKGLKLLHLVFPPSFYGEGYVGMKHDLRSLLDYCKIDSLRQLDLMSVTMSFMSTSGMHTAMPPSKVKEIDMVAEHYKKEILGDPKAYVAKKQAEQEDGKRAVTARRATIRSIRRLRPLTVIQ